MQWQKVIYIQKMYWLCRRWYKRYKKKKGQVNKKKVKTFSREGRRCVVPMSQKDGWVVDDKEDMIPCSEKPKPL